jgi:hypothetical protein
MFLHAAPSSLSFSLGLLGVTVRELPVMASVDHDQRATPVLCSLNSDFSTLTLPTDANREDEIGGSFACPPCQVVLLPLVNNEWIPSIKSLCFSDAEGIIEVSSVVNIEHRMTPVPATHIPDPATQIPSSPANHRQSTKLS